MKDNGFEKKYNFNINKFDSNTSINTEENKKLLLTDINNLSNKQNKKQDKNIFIETDVNQKYKQLINKTPIEIISLKLKCYKRLFLTTYKYFYDNEFTTFRKSVYSGVSILFLSSIIINLAYYFHPLKRSLITLSFITSFVIVSLNWNKNIEELISELSYDTSFRREIGRDVKEIKNELVLYNPFNKYYK